MTEQANAAAPRGSGQPLDSTVWKVAIVAMLGSLLAQLDATIVNVSLATLATDLHASLGTIQWVTSGYLLALSFALPLNGWLIERLGVKTLYLACFVVFTLCSALCAFAWSAAALIGFRLLQGASGGLLAPMAQLSMKRAAGPHFTRIAGYAAAPVLLGPILGPVIAGAILHWASWRWLFLVNLPFGAVAFVLAARFLPQDRPAHAVRRLDWLGWMLLSPGLALVLYGIAQLQQPVGAFAGVAGVLALAVFWLVERRKGDAALLDLDLFRQPTFTAATSIQFLNNGLMFAGQLLVPLFLIQACGFSPATMGWMMAPMGVGMLLIVPLLGRITALVEERWVAMAGAWLALASTLLLGWLTVHGLDVPLLAAALLLRGIGLGAVGLPAMSLAYGRIDHASLPMATTTLNIVQRSGGPIITALCALFLASALHTHDISIGLNAWAETFLLLAVLHVFMIAATSQLPSDQGR